MAAAHDPVVPNALARPYRCFLIRCWLVEGAGPGGATAWRFAVQQPEDSARRRLFGRLSDMEAYLEAQLTLGTGADHETDR